MMVDDVCNNIVNKESKIAVVGLGYVGLPLAYEFSKVANVIGYDYSKERIERYRQGEDVTSEIGDKEIAMSSIEFTSDSSDISNARFIIVTVPTPINPDNTPDLSLIESASEAVGRNLKKGSIVVFESTVYPGVTEDICVPILEKASGFVYKKDFSVGYSPERINPSDKEHVLSNIIKIVSGSDEKTLEEISKIYSLVVKAGVYKAPSIKVAEAAKVIENCQRDINIAFMNELSLIFHEAGIDTNEVLAAAGTKWNFLKFQPGLVGGHCIGVDPYYLTNMADKLGYHSKVILSGRQINDGMGQYIASNVIKALVRYEKNLSQSKVAILGFTFKENCKDVRNTKVYDIIKELKEFNVESVVIDDVADKDEAKRIYGVEICGINDCEDKVDAVISCVQHDEYKKIDINQIGKMYKPGQKILFDIKGMYNKTEYEEAGYYYWRL